jgi:hypothetical protein
MVAAPIMLLLCFEFSRSTLLKFSISLEHREMPFFLDADLSLALEGIFLLLLALDSFRAEYLLCTVDGCGYEVVTAESDSRW